MKINLSDAAAKAVVKAGTTQITRSIQRFSRRADTPTQDDVEIRLAVLASSWSYSAFDSAWKATAKFINEGVVDTRLVDVYAPIYPASATPPGTVNETRFYAMWTGRWELLAESSAPPPGRLMTKTVATGLVANVSDDGWLTISATGTTIHYYGESSQ